MSSIAHDLHNNHQSSGPPLLDVGNVNTQGVELTEQMKTTEENEEYAALLGVFRDELTSDPDPAIEEALACNVENFFQDEPEFAVVVEDFRDALRAQLDYYKRRIASFKLLCDNIRKERDEAENHVRLVEMEATNVSSSTSTKAEVLQAIGAIQAAVKEGSRKLKELSNVIPVSVEPGTLASHSQNPISSTGTNSSSKLKGKILSIKQLVNDFTQSVQSAMNTIQSPSTAPVSSFNILPQVTDQSQPGSSLSRGKEHTTCRQRLKERELEIERLENRIRLAGGIVTDYPMQPDFLFEGMVLGSGEIDEIDEIIEKLQEQVETPDDPGDKLAYYKDLLGKQLVADPTDLSGAAKSIRKEIEKREKWKTNMVITMGKGNNQKFKKLLQMMQAKLEDHRDSFNKYKGRFKYQKEPQQFEASIQNWPEAIKEPGVDSLMNEEKLSILSSKDAIIRTLRKEVQDAHAEAVRYSQEITSLKKDADSKVTDLQKRLADCLVKHATSQLPTSSPYLDDNGGDDGGGDNGGDYEPPEPKKSPSKGSQPKGSQPKGSQPKVSQQNTQQQTAPQQNPQQQNAQQQNPQQQNPQQPRARQPRTPRRPPQILTPRAPKKRKTGERESTLRRVQEESRNFQHWSTDTRRLSRTGF